MGNISATLGARASFSGTLSFYGSTGSAVNITEINLPASAWEGDASPYSQEVHIDGATVYSKVDLLPSAAQLEELRSVDLALTTENDDGVITVYAIGEKPLNDYTLQAAVTEVRV